MKSFRNEKRQKNFVKISIRTVLPFLLLLVVLFFSVTYIGKTFRQQDIELLRQVIKRTAIECYSIEGIYPPSLEYLEENYQLNYDHSKYVIFYDIFSENIMPVIEVYEKK